MYLEKRDKNGLVLSFQAFKEAKEISDYSFNRIKKTKVYEVLAQELCRDSLDNYYKLFFYLDARHYSNQIVFVKSQNLNTTEQKKILNIKNSQNKHYIKKFLAEKKLKFSENFDLKKEYKNLLTFLVKSRNSFNQIIARLRAKKQNQLNKNFKVGVSYKEGIDLNKKSDLYWYDRKKFNQDDVLIYFESNFYKYKHEGEKKLKEKLKKLELNSFDLSDFFYDKKQEFFQNIKIKLKKIKNNDDEMYAKRLSLKLLKKIEFWYCFFKKFQIKIHLDSEELVIRNLEKHLALKILDAYTVGRVRSYISKGVFDFMGSLSADIIFANQKDTANRFIKDSHNIAKHILITGDTNKIFTEENKNEINLINSKINDNKKKFVILILDTNYSDNKSIDYHQMVSREYYNNFYNKLIELANTNKDIFLIVKTKKEKILKNNLNIYKRLKELEKNNSCHIVSKPFGKHPFLFASISHFVVSVKLYLPSALLECVTKGKKGIFCDYANLESVEKEIYRFKKNLIVQNLNYLDKKILEFKNDPQRSNIGDWSLIDGMKDASNRDDGQAHASDFISNLLDEFNKNNSSHNTLNNVVKSFEKRLGKENIINCN